MCSCSSLHTIKGETEEGSDVRVKKQTMNLSPQWRATEDELQASAGFTTSVSTRKLMLSQGWLTSNVWTRWIDRWKELNFTLPSGSLELSSHRCHNVTHHDGRFFEWRKSKGKAILRSALIPTRSKPGVSSGTNSGFVILTDEEVDQQESQQTTHRDSFPLKCTRFNSERELFSQNCEIKLKSFDFISSFNTSTLMWNLVLQMVDSISKIYFTKSCVPLNSEKKYRLTSLRLMWNS